MKSRRKINKIKNQTSFYFEDYLETNKKNKIDMKFCSNKCRYSYNYKTKYKFSRTSNPEYYLKNRDRIREYNKNYYHNVIKPKRKEQRW